MTETPEVIAQVAVPLPIPTIFSYSIPEALLAKAQPGVRVTVPFRNTEVTGYIVALEKGLASFSQKKVPDPLVKNKGTGTILKKQKWLSFLVYLRLIDFKGLENQFF